MYLKAIDKLDVLTKQFSQHEDVVHHLRLAQRELFNLHIDAYAGNELNSYELRCIQNKDKINAIKSYRNRFRLGLAEAKKAVEDYCVKLGLAKFVLNNNYLNFEWV